MKTEYSKCKYKLGFLSQSMYKTILKEESTFTFKYDDFHGVSGNILSEYISSVEDRTFPL